MKTKRPRGRPVGSVIKGDFALLDKMADLILRNPDLRPTQAIKKVMPNWTNSIVHRLLGKWRQQSEKLLENAQQRRENAKYSGSPLSSALHFDEFASATIKRAEARMMSEIAEQTREFSYLLKLQNDPIYRLARELESGGLAKLLKEQQRLKFGV